MTLTIPRSMNGDFPAGTWRACMRNGVRAANFACPLCGFVGGLGQGSNHDIGADGSVHPSVVCDGHGCSFHEFIRLEDWAP